MSFDWGTIDAATVLAGLFASFLGVFLALLLNSKHERRLARKARQRRFAASVREVLALHHNLRVLRNGIDSGSLPKAIDSTPSSAVKQFLPGQLHSIHAAFAELETDVRVPMSRILHAYRAWSNCERVYRGLSTVKSDDSEKLVRLIDATTEAYAELAWRLRNVEISSDEEFTAERWNEISARAKNADSVDVFLSE